MTRLVEWFADPLEANPVGAFLPLVPFADQPVPLESGWGTGSSVPAAILAHLATLASGPAHRPQGFELEFKTQTVTQLLSFQKQTGSENKVNRRGSLVGIFTRNLEYMHSYV